jgi:hypothetical protein
MSSAGILEVLVEKTKTAPVSGKLDIVQDEPTIAIVPQPATAPEEGHTRSLVIGAFILGATMLGAMGGTLLIWAWLR